MADYKEREEIRDRVRKRQREEAPSAFHEEGQYMAYQGSKRKKKEPVTTIKTKPNQTYEDAEKEENERVKRVIKHPEDYSLAHIKTTHDGLLNRRQQAKLRRAYKEKAHWL